MSYYVVVSSDTTYRPNPWRWVIIAIGVLIMSGCQSINRDAMNSGRIVGNAPLDKPLSLADRIIIADGKPSERGAEVISGNQYYQISDRRAGEPSAVAKSMSPKHSYAPVADGRGANNNSTDGYLYVEDDGVGFETFTDAERTRDDSDAMEGPCTCQSCRPNAHHRWGQPNDEYVCDGADSNGRVIVRKDFSIKAGLDPADTVAHFDTVLGETEVEASNRACIYAPRFVAARKIVRVKTEDSIVRAAPMTAREQLVQSRENLGPGHVKQPEAVYQQVDNTIGLRLQQHDPARLRENVLGPQLAEEKQLPFQNLEIVKTGTFEQTQASLVEDAATAAIAWSTIEQVQITIQGMPAHSTQANFGGQEVLLYEVRPGDPHLRLLKLASKCAANSGEKVYFTLRFDNTGDEEIGNITIIDNLPGRLELVADTADCSVEHDFLSYPNDVGSDTLRFEITDPLEPGQGGVIRFQCTVR